MFCPSGIRRLRFRRTIQYSLIVAVAACLAGCSEGWTESDLRLRWKWFRDREIPITEPTVVADDDPRLSIEPEPRPQEPPTVPAAPGDDELGPVPAPEAPTTPTPTPESWGPVISEGAEGDPYATMFFSISDADALGPAGAPEDDEGDGSDEGEDGIRSIRDLGAPPAPTPRESPPTPTEPRQPDPSAERSVADGETDQDSPELVDPLSIEINIDDGPAIAIAPRGTVVAGSMVQVNDRFITINDVLNELHETLSTMPLPTSEYAFRQQVAGMIQEALRDSVYEILVLTRAEAELSEQHMAIVEEELVTARREMIAHAGGSEQALRNYYRERHTTIEEVMAAHRRRLMGQLYLQLYIEPQIVVTPQALFRYYEEHRAEFEQQRRVQMQIIASPIAEFLPPDVDNASPQEWQQARQLARRNIDQAAEAVLSGEDFGQVARRYSHGYHASSGGVWPLMERGSFREAEVERNLFALDEGDVCGIIETEEGFYIIKALAVEPGETLSFEEAQSSIEETLRQEQYRELLNEYFRELFEAATIAQAEEFMDLAIDTAVERYYRADR
jgi:hypothetical protein